MKETRVESLQALLQVVEQGLLSRIVGTTNANQQSSRSHAILQLTIYQVDKSSNELVMAGKFALVDLAGSEKLSDAGDYGRQARMEGSEINKSLLALKECIRALRRQTIELETIGESNVFIPFRASKLTLILRDSFIRAKSETVMIASISPNIHDADHTLNTLRYADRVKEFGKSRKKGESDDEPTFHEMPSPTEKHVESPTFEMEDFEQEPQTSSSEYIYGSQDLDIMYPLGIYSDNEGPLRRSQSDLKSILSNAEESRDQTAMEHLVQVDTLLEQEDDLIQRHIKALNDLEELTEEERELLLYVTSSQHGVDMYINNLSNILSKKREILDELESQVTFFKRQLDDEEALAGEL